MKKVIVLIVASLILVSMTVTLDAQQRRHPRMMRHAGFGMQMVEKNLFPPHILLKMKDEIGLTEAQVSKLDKMQQANQEQTIRAQADIKVQELKFKTYMKEDKVNRAKMEKMIRDISKMKTDQVVSKVNFLLDVKSLLTPEQLDKIEKLKKERMKHLMERRKRFDGERGERREKREIRKERKERFVS